MLTRRDLLKGAAGAGALLVARPFRVFADATTEVWRTSRLPGSAGLRCVHSDLHNHTLLSDGKEQPIEAFGAMREWGLDVAAITDHAVFGDVVGTACAHERCSQYAGINEEAWQTIRTLADAANEDGEFVAMRGFEWTTGTIGHVNVWFSERWIDAFTTMGAQSLKGAPELFTALQQPELAEAFAPVFDELPENATMDLFYEWLASEPDRPLLGGGEDGLAGFNHPNLYGNFNDFRFSPTVANRIVSCEALNGKDDYLFWGFGDGRPSPLNACLNAGWRVGMLGVSDEHGDGRTEGAARGGLWVHDLTRAGVREALEARRFFAAFEPELRLDATANGNPMGATFVHTSGPVTFEVDVAAQGVGRELLIQVLRSGGDVPTVVHREAVTLPTLAPVSFTVPDVRLDEGAWVLLRITEPGTTYAPDAAIPDAFRDDGQAVAYASPFFLEPPPDL